MSIVVPGEPSENPDLMRAGIPGTMLHTQRRMEMGEMPCTVKRDPERGSTPPIAAMPAMPVVIKAGFADAQLQALVDSGPGVMPPMAPDLTTYSDPNGNATATTAVTAAAKAPGAARTADANGKSGVNGVSSGPSVSQALGAQETRQESRQESAVTTV